MFRASRAGLQGEGRHVAGIAGRTVIRRKHAEKHGNPASNSYDFVTPP
jgi:hypothetical protein